MRSEECVPRDPVNVGVYVQVPFCQTKCSYCNFHTGVFARSLYGPYVNAVCRELAVVGHDFGSARTTRCEGSQGFSPDIVQAGFQRASTPEATIDTVYIGGGTPSLLDPPALARILEALRSNFRCALSEVTLEADPETITAEKAAAWRATGINRVSLGAQSFADAELRAAGRMHRSEDIHVATRLLRAAGFDNINLDLIAGLPHQSAASWSASVEALLGLRPEHISIYLLEIDDASRLGREVLAGGSHYSASALPSEDQMADFYDLAGERLATAGYEHYEISNWALPGRRSRHNLKYWRREPYFGFGAGAHSFNGVERWANVHEPVPYICAIEKGLLPIEQRETLTAEQALEEEVFLGLRQLEGIDLARLQRQYNSELARGLRARAEELRCRSLVELDGCWLRLAPARLTVANEALVELLS